MASTPEPPPVQRPQAPPVQSDAGPPPVQRREAEDAPPQNRRGFWQQFSTWPVRLTDEMGPTPSTPGKWDWWPDHPGKRVMIAATAAWVGLLLPTFIVGRYAAYASARGGGGTNNYLVGHRIVTPGKMESMAVWNGMEYIGWLTVAWVAAIAVGCVMVMSLERRGT